MLIAIMGDTFDKVTEDKHVNATKTKLSLITRPTLSKNVRPNEINAAASSND